MADPGYGIQFKRGDGEAVETFTAIANVEDITPPSLARDTIETSDHSSTAKYRTYMGGLRDAGEVSLVINYAVAGAAHNALRNDLESDDPVNYQIVFPDDESTTWQFSALVTAFAPATPRDGKVTANITLKISGQPDFDA